MIYDRADWHYHGDYPSDLPPQNGGTHIGIFFAWLVNHHMESERLALEYSAELDAIRARQLSGREFIAKRRDGQLSDEEMNEEARAFAHHYYDSEEYFSDYARILVGSLPSLYHVDDTWQSYDAMASCLDERFAAWHKQHRPWWRIW